MRSRLLSPPIRTFPGNKVQGSSRREYGSRESYAAATERTISASPAVKVSELTQSSERQAGTTPKALKRPRVGLCPTILLNAAGTRPEPAVSVPSANETSPAATATAEPELDPPEI